MAGGLNAALERGHAELINLGISGDEGHWAVDLGSGFIMHAIPLARLGFRVLAIDQCALLLRELEAERGTLPVTCVEDDLSGFPRHLQCEANLVLCMNDTLTYLPDIDAVLSLIKSVASSLAENGRFIITFREYSESGAAQGDFILSY